MLLEAQLVFVVQVVVFAVAVKLRQAADVNYQTGIFVQPKSESCTWLEVVEEVSWAPRMR